MTKRFFIILALLFSFGLAAEEEMPQVAYYSEFPDMPPHWVAAEAALDDVGKPRLELFGSGSLDHLRLLMERDSRGPGQCTEIRNEIPGNHAENIKNLELLAQDSDWIFLAEVTGSLGGFRRGFPGTLLRIEPESVFKGPVDRNYPHYIYLPIGEIELGSKRLCVSDVRYPELPEIGEKVLVHVRLTSRNSGEFLFGSDAMTISFPEGMASLPGRYRESHSEVEGQPFAEVMTFIESVSAVQEQQ